MTLQHLQRLKMPFLPILIDYKGISTSSKCEKSSTFAVPKTELQQYLYNNKIYTIIRFIQ